MIMKPWHLRLYGAGISFGDAVHVIASPDRKVRLTTWKNAALTDRADKHGKILVGDHALLCPGVRIDSAFEVRVGSGSMLASGVYLTDSDWHDVYDRTQPVGASRPVILQRNTWIGDGSIVCKGVTIGENSIVGAGSVVTRSIPPNVIAAGNPAVPVKPLDPAAQIRSRSDLLSDPHGLNRYMDDLDRELRKENTWGKWIRTTLRPGAED